jgi:protein-L-isoaspartate(D-aspartate) O-methyltransferase
MLGQQIRACEVTDPRVLEALGAIPREDFVPPGFGELAFADTAIPIGHGQRMLTPQIEGRILQALQIQPNEEILEIGTGTGFLTACLRRLGASVHSIDVFSDFVSAAQRRLDQHRLSGISVEVADATTCHWSRQYNVVVISAALPQLSARFTDLLKPHGRMFVFTGEAPIMRAQLVTRMEDGSLATDNLFETLVEPMINARPEATFVL